jgi:endonuclease YncB( thermonuclease family)
VTSVRLIVVSLTLYTYRSVVFSVWDGDTANGQLDLGINLKYTIPRLRLAGINAHEISRPEGVQPRDHLRDLLGPLPASVTIQTFKDRADNYGRPLGRIIRSDGVDLNQKMIDDAFAVAMGPLPS